MKQNALSLARVRNILAAASRTRTLVIGDVMLDHFIWGHVARISPEAPVPVVDFDRESFIPGGAANVARNLTALQVPTDLFGVVGRDQAALQLKQLLTETGIGCTGLLPDATRATSVKARIVAHQQQVVRLDRETRGRLDHKMTRRLLAALEAQITTTAAVIIGDYGKGVVTQDLLDGARLLCRRHGVWLSLDPKPVHQLNLTGLSLITPNRKEAFELANLPDDTKDPNPLADKNLMLVVERLLKALKPVLLLVTLGELGMLLCREGQKPFHIPTQAQEVFDVSGAGDTVIASFTLAIAGGASPVEAAMISNHAAGIVVGKVGTAVTSPAELVKSFQRA
ncbi:bifunctional heptose 7-phosphate kinase/heptose 1-phosphate adenyltransferase [Pedosphaera parvula]|uniref:PfkB domain protein n=1 Tax=Pedosphaera parvula (strain Ellin514) TaxID=320771 RepID=B9XGJ7_PEDPL|nr:PfkB family carbohydrate kinase [Pedosphaera parvula]EEF61048.1 PfkB domain protein [Pedosphaera parvula Ellin514]